MTTKQILSCDWGTSSFRLRLVNVTDGSVLAETFEGKGIAAVYNEWLKNGLAEGERITFYKNILLEKIKKITNDPLGNLPIIISGMSSSSIGMKELPYQDIPFAITGDRLDIHAIQPDEKFQHPLLMVSGLKTGNDVMRGEETMLLGCDINDDDNYLVIFPGTHSKHVVIKNKTVTGFKTYMTGEVFDLLMTGSILSKSIIKEEGHQYPEIFEMGLREAEEGNLLNIAFHVRTNHLLGKLSAAQNYDYLSGLLIGTELKQISLGADKIMLVCGHGLSERYLQALRVLAGNKSLQFCDADIALIKGHCKLAAIYL